MTALSLRRRVAAALVAAVVATAALFGLASLVFAYTVEDEIFAAELADEAARQQRTYRAGAPLAPPLRDFISVHRGSMGLPADLARQYRPAARQQEYFGDAGRHYHVQRFVLPDGPAVVVAEVSRQLVVRRHRDAIILFLTGLGLTLALVIGALGAWAANRAMAPLTRLSAALEAAGEGLPAIDPAAYRAPEIGRLAAALNGAFARIARFVAREQAFTRDASHELRTPIAVIRGAAEVIALQSGLPAPVPAALRRIETATADMTQTLDLLLALAREGQSPDASPTPLRPLIDKAVADAAARWPGSGVRVTIEAPADALCRHGPVLQLVLNNLVGNCFQHAAGSHLRIAGDATGLTIADSGPERLAGPSGSGLGLEIVTRLCAGAGIGFAALPGPGTAYRLDFAAAACA
jgi:signal transduction histidine kinase